MIITFKKIIGNIQVLKKLSPEQDIVLVEVYEYVSSRLILLEADINREELEDKNRATIIYFPSKWEIAFIFQGYTEELREKMKACISKEDLIYLRQKIDNALFALLN